MKDWLSIISLARRSLIVLGAALVLALALYLGSDFFKTRGQAQLAQARQLDQASRSSLSEKQIVLANMQTEINRFNLLRQQGMVGTPERESWVEQLVASHQHAGLPDTLSYALQAPKPLALQGGPATAAAPTTAPAEAGTATTADPLFHDLNIELRNIHEEELLALLRDYKAQVKGRFRVNACTLSNRTETGLSAHCTLRFFTLPDDPSRPNPQ